MPFSTGQDGLLSHVAPLLCAQYYVTELLGEGGMGQVYKGEHRITGQEVAIKVLRRELLSDQVFRTRFLLEAQVLSKLDHPSITHLYNFIEEADGALYLVMQYVPGPTLEQLIERVGPLPSMVAVTLAHEILDAFEYAHSRGVIHRDIKPSNIVLSPGGGIKVMDFGIARVNEGIRITDTGDSLGSPGYMSPEQVTGTELDHRCDIYSLGVMLFEMVTGDLPFLAESGYLVMKAHAEQPAPDPRELVESVPEAVAEAILWAMKKLPDERPGSASELAEAIPTAEELGGNDDAAWDYVLNSHPALMGQTQTWQNGGHRAPSTAPRIRRPPRARRPVQSASMNSFQRETSPDLQSTLSPPEVPGLRTPPRSSPIPALLALVVLSALVVTGIAWWMNPDQDVPVVAKRAPVVLPPGEIPTVINVKGGEMVFIPQQGLTEGFYIDRTEVTYQQYRAFLEKCPIGTPCGPENPVQTLQLSKLELFPVIDHPVSKVTQTDAEKYCLWAGKRLPTSSEWTRAAAGPDDLKYPWGNEVSDTKAWIAAPIKNVRYRPGQLATISVHDVDYYQDVSTNNIMGMGGNLSEWLADADPHDRNLRLVAGGAWSTYDIEAEAACDYRVSKDPSLSSSSIGFRCASDMQHALRSGSTPLLYQIRKAGKVRVGTELDSRPMIYEKDGVQVGFEYEFMQYLAEYLGVSLKISPGMYPDFPAKLRAGSIDLIVSAYTPDISYRGLQWSDSYLEYGLCLIVRKDSPIHSVKDLSGKVVGHYTDAATARAVQRLAPGASRQVSYENHYLEDIRDGQLDAFLYDFPFAQAEIAAFKDKDKIRIAQYGLTDATYNIGIPEGEWSLTRELNLAIRALRASDRYVEMVHEYLGGVSSDIEVPTGARATLVQPGDTLRSVAKRELGDASRWTEIWELNRSRLGNQNLLIVDTPILLPLE